MLGRGTDVNEKCRVSRQVSLSMQNSQALQNRMQPRLFPGVTVILVFYKQNTNFFCAFFTHCFCGKRGGSSRRHKGLLTKRKGNPNARFILTTRLPQHSKVCCFVSACL